MKLSISRIQWARSRRRHIHLRHLHRPFGSEVRPIRRPRGTIFAEVARHYHWLRALSFRLEAKGGRRVSPAGTEPAVRSGSAMLRQWRVSYVQTPLGWPVGKAASRSPSTTKTVRITSSTRLANRRVQVRAADPAATLLHRASLVSRYAQLSAWNPRTYPRDQRPAVLIYRTRKRRPQYESIPATRRRGSPTRRSREGASGTPACRRSAAAVPRTSRRVEPAVVAEGFSLPDCLRGRGGNWRG